MSAHVWKTLFDNHSDGFRLMRRQRWDCSVHYAIDGLVVDFGGTAVLAASHRFDDYADAQRWCDQEVARVVERLTAAGISDVTRHPAWDGVIR